MASLEQPLEKLRRAETHLQQLQAEMADFMASKPYAIEIGKVDDAALFRLRILRPLPADLGLLIGDYTQNLRACLDYLILQLSLATNPKLSLKERKETQFPILLKANSRELGRRLQYVPPEVVKQIEALQPYHKGDQAHQDSLAVLADLSNRDKHREITPIGIAVREVFVSGERFMGSRERIVEYRDKAHITLVPIELVPKLGQDYQVSATFEVMMETGGGPSFVVGVSSLNELHEYVRDVVLPRCSGPLK
jgi:hypothetical protein